MSSTLDRYRPPAREGYQPPTLPPKPLPIDRLSKSPSRRRDVPPAVPSPPTNTYRTSPPRPPQRKSVPSPAKANPPPPSPPSLSQWFFTADEVLSTPSIIDGLPPAEERLRRAKGVNFIYQAGILLDLPQITLWVAGVFFHRFYMRYSMVEEKAGIHHYNIAATSLFLANKTEENCRRTKEIIVAVARVAQKNAKLIIDEQSKEYWRWRDSILTYEELMLEALTFDLVVDNPYQRLFDQLRQLSLASNKRLREAAWTFCNDLCLTSLPLLMEARDLAVGAIFFASTVTREKIDDVDGEAWWKFLKGNENLVSKAVETMAEFYSENPLRKQISAYPGSPVFNLESTRRTGESVPSQTETGSSYNGTPAGTDRGDQSPVARMNGKEGVASAEKEVTADGPQNGTISQAESEGTKGDSDSSLKVAANNLDTHQGQQNGSSLRSPGVKRSNPEPEQVSDSERQSKRVKTDDEDEDEGEIR